MKILCMTKEDFLQMEKFLNACRYEWTFIKQKTVYLITIFY